MFPLKQTASDHWASLVPEVDQVLRTMPLWKLQTVGDERLEFLYINLDRGNRITLKPGVAYCFRAFYELVRDLVEGCVGTVRSEGECQQDRQLTDLGTFLFGQARNSLDAYRPILLDAQKGACLYYQKPLSKQSLVDQIVPWSAHPKELGPNFALAHDKCNNAKSVFLQQKTILSHGWNAKRFIRPNCKSDLSWLGYRAMSRPRCKSPNGCTCRSRKQMDRCG